MRAETDQERPHRLEVLRRNDFVRRNERRQEIHDHQNTFDSNFQTDGDLTRRRRRTFIDLYRSG